MADSKLAPARVDTASPPPHCAICLGTCKNKCRANSCMHEFCYSCLVEWSRIKAECPLCKQEFKSIIHNIKSINEYDVHVVENMTAHMNRHLENASLIYLPPATPPAMHQYHFRTTFTVDTNGEHAIQQMLLSHPLLTIGGFTPDRYTHHRRRRGDTSATTFRRSVYNQNLWVYAPPDITGRYRDVSPSFFRNNPAARTRLVPWLNRELNALLYENTQQVMHLVDIIMDHLLRHHICSYMFRSLLYEYLSNKTDHFIHEFYNFMRSPFDMIGYDRHVIYTERRPSPIRFIDEIDVSDYDSDVILVSDTNNNQRGQGADPVIIDLVETDSDEPIIVSEERNETRCAEEEQTRKPILPLKLRIKNRHKSKEKRRGKRRHRATSSSSSSSTTEESSSESDEYKRYQQKRYLKKFRKEKKKKRENSYYIEKAESSDEGDVPLASLASRKKRSKHSKHKSHTITSDKKEKKHSHRHQDRVNEPCDIPPENSSQHDQESLGSVNDDKSNKTDNEMNSDDSFYSGHKPNVKSKIKDARSEDKHKAGPSSGRLKNTLKKEASTNLWYSRPLPYDPDSDSSDN